MTSSPVGSSNIYCALTVCLTVKMSNTHPLSVTVLRPTYISAHLTFITTLEGVQGCIHWIEEETEAPEVE